ncbi:MAG: hypothetical protein GYB32_09295 [Algicola sp.]|nr:hypothetical protein [Algicola sp.]
MKKIVFILMCIFAVTICSCDRRSSKKERLEHAVHEFNNKYKSLDIKTYYPEAYVEIKTDSIVSKTFHVSIVNHSLSDTGILIKESINGKSKSAHYHRVFESEINIKIADKMIFDKHISAKNFSAFSNSHFWRYATLEHVWVNEEHSDPTKVALNLSFMNPKDHTYQLYELLVDREGNELITLIKDYTS